MNKEKRERGEQNEPHTNEMDAAVGIKEQSEENIVNLT